MNSVLLKGVNDNAETMGALIRELADNNIQPVGHFSFFPLSPHSFPSARLSHYLLLLSLTLPLSTSTSISTSTCPTHLLDLTQLLPSSSLTNSTTNPPRTVLRLRRRPRPRRRRPPHPAPNHPRSGAADPRLDRRLHDPAVCC